MNHTIKLATSPTSWGVDFADAPSNPLWSEVLDEIARSEVGALELGPVGYLPEQPVVIRDELARRGLIAVGSFLFEDLHDPSQKPRILDITERACRVIAAAEGSTLVVIDRPGPERVKTAGDSRAARRLDKAEWRAMLDTIGRLSAIANAHGLRPVIHPHAGSYIEFRDEIERLLSDSELSLCLDTGHTAYAGIHADEALLTYSDRLAHVHLKDVDPLVISRVLAEGLDFWQAIAAGVFCPLGNGVVRLDAVADALRFIRYEGFATIEQDRVPHSGEPLDDLRECVAALGRVGLGRDTTTSASDTA